MLQIIGTRWVLQRDAAAEAAAPTGAAVARYDGRDRRALLAVAPAHREREQTLGPPKPLPPPSPAATKGEKTLRFLGFLVWPPDSDLLLRARLDGCHRVFVYTGFIGSRQ